jgi:sugar O-acyltransferase (sialic acid O-acetyltransferase NeuD family)
MSQELLVPNLSVNDDELQIFFVIEDGARVSVGEQICEFESSKSTAVYSSESEGYIKFLVGDGDTVKVGKPFALLSLNDFTSTDFDKKMLEPSASQPLSNINLTNKAAKLIKELNLDETQLPSNVLLKEEDIISIFGLSKSYKKEKSHSSSMGSRYERVVIIGAGKGAEVVIDLLRDDLRKKIVGLVDDNLKEMPNYSYPILECSVEDFPDKIERSSFDTVIISFGADLRSMIKRYEVFKQYKSKGIKFTNVISSKALIKSGVIIGEGNLLGDNVYIGTMTEIGDNNSISYSAIIGHHNTIGSHNLIAPSVNTSGSVIIGDNCILPAGVNVINRVRIGNSCIFPIGYNVISDIENSTVFKNEF